LMSLNSEWSGCRIRILRVVREEHYYQRAHDALQKIMDAARMSDAEVNVIVSDQSFDTILQSHSNDATVVFMGFAVPELRMAEQFHRQLAQLLESLPTVLLIHSTGEADLMQ
ncbi:MAG: hypothetical protein ACOC41_05130, partial [Chitinivibrionales bacterium]